MAAPSAAPLISVTCAAARPRATFAAPSASPVSCTCCACDSAARIVACRTPSAFTIAARRSASAGFTRRARLRDARVALHAREILLSELLDVALGVADARDRERVDVDTARLEV